jgi:3',5'-cyclic AMP phosphodiesterase CpdA
VTKIIHISDLHIHDRQSNFEAVVEGFKDLAGGSAPAGKKPGLLSRGISAFTMLKRLGYSTIHDRPDLRRALLEDIDREDPDHILISGDITNTALRWECEEARACFDRYIEERRLSIVPGNHDYPVFMQGTARILDFFADSFPNGKVKFPFVKLIGKDLAVIGLNSCLRISDFLSSPDVLIHTARGKIDRDQLEMLSKILPHPRMAGRYKIVFLHHHVLEHPRQKGGGRIQKARDYFMEKAVNSEVLLKLLREHGGGMVLHGHRHVRQINTAQGLLIVGAGSAIHEDPETFYPSYHIYEFEADAPKITVKALDGDRYRIFKDENFLPGAKQLALWRYSWMENK